MSLLWCVMRGRGLGVDKCYLAKSRFGVYCLSTKAFITASCCPHVRSRWSPTPFAPCYAALCCTPSSHVLFTALPFIPPIVHAHALRRSYLRSLRKRREQSIPLVSRIPSSPSGVSCHSPDQARPRITPRVAQVDDQGEVSAAVLVSPCLLLNSLGIRSTGEVDKTY